MKTFLLRVWRLLYKNGFFMCKIYDPDKITTWEDTVKRRKPEKKKHPYTVIFNGIERVLSKEDYETMEEHLHHL